MPGGINLPLNDLSAFKNPGQRWQTAGGAMADYAKDGVMMLIKGTGAAIYLPSGNVVADNLVTQFETGDLDLELDFMLAVNTQAALFLQGRYAIILNDSWSKNIQTVQTTGAIGERWEESRSVKGYEGLPPSMNICRAPGLWQHLKLKFRAPQVDQSGKKIRDAVFEEVVLNGTTVQLQVQVSGPSRGALFTDEKSLGPLVFQASGPLAISNIRYRSVRPLKASVTNLTYKYYKGEFPEQFPDMAKYTVNTQGTIPALTGIFNAGDATFMSEINGSLEVPSAETYTFALLTNGLGRLYIDDQLQIDRITNRWNKRYYIKAVELTQGTHKLRLVYVKNVGNGKPGLALTVKAPDSDPVVLNDPSSTPVTEFTDPVEIVPSVKPYLLRSFLEYGSKKLTHTVSVGDPTHLNYSYDLKQGAIIQVWRGDFLDVTNMWVQRGEPQTANPLGSLVRLTDAPALAVLDDIKANWPDSIAFDDLQPDGYVLDQQRAPTFQYRLKNAMIKDKISIAEAGKSLLREINIEGAPANFYSRLAIGNKIETVTEGVYRFDDQSYYIRIDKRFKAMIRQTQKGSELIVPITAGNAAVSYYITW